MGKQSARIYFNGKDHKDIYYNGHYHDAMYIGDTLVWQKLHNARWAYQEIFLDYTQGDNPDFLPIIAYGNGVFVALYGNHRSYGHSHKVYYTIDGEVWHLANGEVKGNPRFVTYGNGKFAILTVEIPGEAGGGLYVSENGMDWRRIEYCTIDGEINDPSKLIFAPYARPINGKFFARTGESAQLLTSSDLFRWTTVAKVPGANMPEVYFDGYYYWVSSSVERARTFSDIEHGGERVSLPIDTGIGAWIQTLNTDLIVRNSRGDMCRLGNAGFEVCPYPYGVAGASYGNGTYVVILKDGYSSIRAAEQSVFPGGEMMMSKEFSIDGGFFLSNVEYGNNIFLAVSDDKKVLIGRMD